MSTIVWAAIAVFILVLVILITTGTMSDILAQFKDTTNPVGTAKSACNIQCNSAKADSNWEASLFCTDTHKLKINEEEQFLNCWEAPISVMCKDTDVVGGKYSVKYVDADGKCAVATDLTKEEADALKFYAGEQVVDEEEFEE